MGGGVWRQPASMNRNRREFLFSSRSSLNLSALRSLSLSLPPSVLPLCARPPYKWKPRARHRSNFIGWKLRSFPTYISNAAGPFREFLAFRVQVERPSGGKKTGRGFHRVPAGQGSGRETETTKTKRARQEVPLPRVSGPKVPRECEQS